MIEQIPVSFADEQACRELTFKWSLAWDLKDKSIFLSITAPEVLADYSDFPAVNTKRVVPPSDLFDRSFANANLGHKDLQTQHLLGAHVFTYTNANATEIKGNWQTYARHVRRLGDGDVREWNSSNVTEFTYTVVDGKWKLSGLRPHTIVCATGTHNDVVGEF